MGGCVSGAVSGCAVDQAKALFQSPHCLYVAIKQADFGGAWMQTAEISFGGVMSQCAEVARARLGLTLATIFLITAGFSLLDLFPNRSASAVPSLIVNLYVQYHFVKALLSDNIIPSQPRKHKYGSLFLAGLLGGLGMLAGTILLVLPGIFLMARWSISTPFIVAEDLSGSAALKASWDATFEARWALFAVFVAFCAGLGALFVAVILINVTFDFGQESLFLSVATNFLVSLCSVGGWILGVGIYRGLRPSSNMLAGVFA